MSVATTTTVAIAPERPTSYMRNSSSGSKRSGRGGKSAGPSENVRATLRNLYDRAKHAFLQRDLGLTNELLNQAFALLTPPSSSSSRSSPYGQYGQYGPSGQSLQSALSDSREDEMVSIEKDSLESQRKKWEILRITLYTTLYTSTLSEEEKQKITFKGAFLPSRQFLQLLYQQALSLFVPKDINPSIGYVPDQVVLLLVVSAVKLEEVGLAKDWVEDWLVRRGSRAFGPLEYGHVNEEDQSGQTTYEKIVDVYVLHVLPRLGLWDEAREFLRYEGEMTDSNKMRITQTLAAQHERAMRPADQRSRSPSKHRSPSPSPSLASSTSSSSTTTVILNGVNGGPPRPPSAASISSSASTATIRPTRDQAARPGSFAMTLLPHQTNGTLDKGKARETATPYDTGLEREETIRPMGNGTAAPGVSPGPSVPLSLPQPPLSPRESNGAGPSTVAASDSRKVHLSTTMALLHLLRSSTLPYLHDIARFLNHQFNLNLSTDFDIPIPELYARISNLWYIIFVIVPLALFWNRLRGRLPAGERLIAGDAARRKLKAQASRNALAVGPQLGSAFWKSAMTAVLDAVSMGGRGLI